jgi:integrase
MAKKQKLPPGIRRLSRPGDRDDQPTGKYQARYTIIRDGRRSQVSAGTFHSLAEAKDALAAAQASYRAGVGWVDPSHRKLTVGQWADEWEELQRGRNTKTVSFLRARIRPQWQDWRLDAVTPAAVQKWVNAMADEDLSPATITAVYATFKRMLAKAVDYDLLAKSPCRTITLPPPRRTEIVPLTVEQIALLEQNAPARYRAMIHLAAWGGLRWGELAALRWEDVDLEAGVVHVQRGVTAERKIGPTKNGKDRLVTIAPTTVEVLRAHRRDFGGAEWVFTTGGRGVRLNYDGFRQRVWLPLVEQCGLDASVTFHKLRHAHAGHMVMQGMDWKVLADRLGHHAPSFTADVYGWRRPDHADVTTAAIEKAMGATGT